MKEGKAGNFIIEPTNEGIQLIFFNQNHEMQIENYVEKNSILEQNPEDGCYNKFNDIMELIEFHQLKIDSKFKYETSNSHYERGN